jgi:NadR type nicotinamide-nucleotide adenylyltransferase
MVICLIFAFRKSKFYVSESSFVRAVFFEKMPHNIFKIAITGPESTGKSSLAKELARHYNATFVPEYAREYMSNLNRNYTSEDILLIAQKQLENEKAKMNRAMGCFLFCDTDLLVTRIWSLHKYGECDPWIDKHIRKNHYDLFLLCDIDLPWQFDEQREHPNLRQYFFNWYKNELENFGFPYQIVSGTGEKRNENAVKIIDKVFNN